MTAVQLQDRTGVLSDERCRVHHSMGWQGLSTRVFPASGLMVDRFYCPRCAREVSAMGTVSPEEIADYENVIYGCGGQI